VKRALDGDVDDTRGRPSRTKRSRTAVPESALSGSLERTAVAGWLDSYPLRG